MIFAVSISKFSSLYVLTASIVVQAAVDLLLKELSRSSLAQIFSLMRIVLETLPVAHVPV